MKLNKILAVAFLAASALSSASFSMDHPDMKVARTATQVRQIGNQALRDRDAALAAHGAVPALYASAVATVGGAVQPLLNDCAATVLGAVDAYLDTLVVGADGPLLAALVGAPIAGAAFAWGPNGGPAINLADPLTVNRDALKAAIAIAVRDELTQAELAHHNAGVVPVVDAKLSTTTNVINAIIGVLADKVDNYVGDLLGHGAPDAPLTVAVVGGAQNRDAFIANLRAAIEAAY